MQLGYDISLSTPSTWGGLSAAIRALFAAGEQGAWYDPSDLTTLFQDSAGTTPVTTTGQPVGKMLDKSGRGNHATQATAAARPVLQIDAGKYYLAFDGVDDSMSTASINFTATDKMMVVAGVRKTVDAVQIIAELSTNGANAGAFYVVSGTDSGGTGYSAMGTGTAAGGIAKAFTYSGVDTAVLAITHDIFGDLSTIRRNGVAATSGVGDKGVSNFGNYPLYIGARAGTSIFFNGRIYSMIICGAASSAAQITSAETYANSKTGAF